MRNLLLIFGILCFGLGWLSRPNASCGLRDALAIRSAPAAERGMERRCKRTPPPGPSIEPFVRKELAVRFAELRPSIIDAARRHNPAGLSGMADHEFAEVMAVILYNEQNGWFEDEIEPLRLVTPLYQASQRVLNQTGIGSNFSVWPSNLRPSVALEILREEVPLPEPNQVLEVQLPLAGSSIDPAEFTSQRQLYAAINAELSDHELAIEYLAANLARGVHRAHYENVPITWRALAAWHNQGIVDPLEIRANPTARDYVRRASAYQPLARSLIAGDQLAEGERKQRE